MLSRSGLERLCLALVAVMTAEVGYLWGAHTAPVEREVVMLEPAAAPVLEPGPFLAMAPATAVVPQVTTEPPAAAVPRRRERPGRPATPTASPPPGAVDDCARSGDPLCGLPGR